MRTVDPSGILARTLGQEYILNTEYPDAFDELSKKVRKNIDKKQIPRYLIDHVRGAAYTLAVFKAGRHN